MRFIGRHPNTARRVEVSLAARGFRECGALGERFVARLYVITVFNNN